MVLPVPCEPKPWRCHSCASPVPVPVPPAVPSRCSRSSRPPGGARRTRRNHRERRAPPSAPRASARRPRDREGLPIGRAGGAGRAPPAPVSACACPCASVHVCECVYRCVRSGVCVCKCVSSQVCGCTCACVHVCACSGVPPRHPHQPVPIPVHAGKCLLPRVQPGVCVRVCLCHVPVCPGKRAGLCECCAALGCDGAPVCAHLGVLAQVCPCSIPVSV